MKVIIKFFGVMAITFVMLLSFTGCSDKYDFYQDWHDAGADIEKSNIYELISLDKAKQMKENSETFALLYASSKSIVSVNLVTELQVQAEYLGCKDAVVYVINANDYVGATKRKTVNSTLGMHEAPSNGSPVVMTFINGVVDVDTSNINNVQTKKFLDSANGNSVLYPSLASYIFKELGK